MLEKNNRKISVLSKMIGLGEEIDSPYVVPQNSVVNFSHRGGLCEKQPIQNSSRNLVAAHAKCPHCENMAKNFLYLESLIRSNYNANNHCNVCHSSLQYLQYVNKSIIEVFGNFDSIVEAAKAFGNPEKRYNKLAKQRSRQSKLNSSFTSAILQKSASFKKPPAVNKTTKKTKSKTRERSHMGLKTASKNSTRSKINVKRTKKFESNSKQSQNKKPSKVNAKLMIRKLKQKK